MSVGLTRGNETYKKLHHTKSNSVMEFHYLDKQAFANYVLTGLGRLNVRVVSLLGNDIRYMVALAI